MKSIIIIAIIVPVIIGIILAVVVIPSMQQQAEFDDFDKALNDCQNILLDFKFNSYIDQTTNQRIIKEHGICIENLWQDHATTEMIQKRDEDIQNKENSLQTLIQQCREINIGQLSEMQSCIDFVNNAYSSQSTEYTPPTCNYTLTQQMMLDSLKNDDSIDDSSKMEQMVRIIKEACN